MICSKCLVDKSAVCFSSRGNGKLHKQCKDCKKIAISRHYQANKKLYKDRATEYNKKIREEIKQYIKEYKEQRSCADCGRKFAHYIMDFDHIGSKKYNVSDLGFCGSSMETLLDEIAKCEVVCSNCHRERTCAENIHHRTQSHCWHYRVFRLGAVFGSNPNEEGSTPSHPAYE